MRGLEGQRVIVVGAAGGMGQAAAIRLAEEGARLVMGDINARGLEETLAGITGKGGQAVAMPCDLSDGEAIKAIAQRCVDEYGGIDGLVNSAADLSPGTLQNDAPIAEMDEAIWLRTLTVNLIGHALLIKEVLPHMIAGGGGSIVSVSSAGAYHAVPKFPAYAASKAGLHALIRNVAQVYGKDNIRCNAVAPGLVLTEGGMANMTEAMKEEGRNRIALRRAGKPQDIGAMLAYLLSEDANWISGQGISINGGAYFRD